MNLVLLTTPTPHHIYYAAKLHEQFPLRGIVVETRQPRPAFETFHEFERRREEYERQELLSGLPSDFESLTQSIRVASVNESDAVERIQALKPDLLLVFGTGRIDPAVIGIPVKACLNLHGGNPEHYRGLDTHLWAIYHRDFANLITTLHHVDIGLDTGDIVSQGAVPLHSGCEIHMLRSLNTRVCVDLSVAALNEFQSTGTLSSRKQTGRGRYYSHMPAVLKDDCVGKFNDFVSHL